MKKLFITFLILISIQSFGQNSYYIGSKWLFWDGRNLKFDSARNGTFKYFASRDWVQDYVLQNGGNGYTNGYGLSLTTNQFYVDTSSGKVATKPYVTSQLQSYAQTSSLSSYVRKQDSVVGGYYPYSTNPANYLTGVGGYIIEGANIDISGEGTYNSPLIITGLGGASGNTNSNIGSGYRFAVNGTNNIKTFFGGYGLTTDSTTNSNAITTKVDTSLVSTKANVNSLLQGYLSASAASNYVPITRLIVSGNGITGGGALSGNLTLRADTSVLQTRASNRYSIDANYNVNGGISNYGSLTSGTNNVAIGNTSFTTTTSGSRNIAIGVQQMPKVTTANDLIAIGYNNYKNVSVSNLNSNAGISIGNNNNGWSKYKNLSIGSYNVGYNVDSIDAVNAIAADNMAIGVENLFNLRQGTDNMVFSWDGLQLLDSGSNNNVIGQYGYEAMLNGNSNQAFGWRAGYHIQHGDRNIFIGDSAGKGALITSNGAIFIGAKTVYNTVTSLSNAIVIGDSATIGQNNLAVIGKSGTWLAIGRATADESIHTNGAIVIGNSTNSDDGTIRWTGSDFQGRKSGAWVSLTTAASGGIVVALTDGTTINTDASQGNTAGATYRVTLGGNRTIANPTNLVDGQRIIYEIHQDATGSRTVTWGSMFTWSTDIPLPTLSTTASYVDQVAFVYNQAANKCYVSGVNLGIH